MYSICQINFSFSKLNPIFFLQSLWENTIWSYVGWFGCVKQTDRLGCSMRMEIIKLYKNNCKLRVYMNEAMEQTEEYMLINTNELSNLIKTFLSNWVSISSELADFAGRWLWCSKLKHRGQTSIIFQLLLRLYLLIVFWQSIFFLQLTLVNKG